MTPANAPVYLNGRFMTVGECCIDALDRGFLFGDAVYEVVPVYDGRMFEWAAHFERLERSLAAVGIDAVHTCEEWEAILDALIQAFTGDELCLYLQISRGVGPRSYAPQEEAAPTVFAMAMPAKPLPREVFEEGAAAVTGEDIRWARCDIKTVSLIANVMIKMRAADEGAYDVILLHDGFVTESTSSNVFIVKDGVLATTPIGPRILPGVTRGVLLALAGEHGVEACERRIAAAELAAAEEIWLSSSTKEIVPVTRLNGNSVGTGVPGPMWRAFRGYLKAFVEASATG